MQTFETRSRARLLIASLTSISLLAASSWITRPAMASCDDLMACYALVDFESIGLLTAFGAPDDSPGSLLFIEDLIQVYSAPFNTGGSTHYETMQVRSALAGMGDGKVMQTTNISQYFDFSAIDAEIEGVRFEFLSNGGLANVAVNGGPLFIGAMFALPSEIAPGVFATLSFDVLPDGAIRGCVELDGNVVNLLLGADNMWWDNICVITSDIPPGGCDPLADAESLPLGECWGSAYGDVVGSRIFFDNGIPVRYVPLLTDTGAFAGRVCVLTPPPSTLGWGDRSISLQAAGTVYSVEALGANVGVSFDFWEGDGPFNLQVNREPILIANSIADIGPSVALGVTLTIDATPGPGGYLMGRATLEGNVRSLRIAGGQWFHDNICVFEDATTPDTPVGLDVVVSPVDVIMGGTPVELTFDEITSAGSTSLFSAILPVTLAERFVGAQSPYYEISTTAVHAGQVEVCVTYDELALTVPEAELRIFHGEAVEFVSDLPWLYDFVDVTATHDVGANTICGTVDHLSPFVLATSTVTAVGDAPSATRVSVQQNVPNPFNPLTTIVFEVPAAGAHVSVKVYDAAGRYVKTLVDGRRTGGAHQVTWDGTDAAGSAVASGVYFYRLRSGSEEITRRMALVR